jgi:dTDP-4-dehydrorhamnose 3,5-epimerase-like enzyme
MGDSKQITINDVKIYNVKTNIEGNGNLSPIQSIDDVPFEIKRIFYVFGVNDFTPRGCHAHYKTRQLLICLNGKIEVLCKDGYNQKRFLLDSPQQGLYLPEMIWDEQIYRSPDSILLSLCSTKYDRRDYIHNYEEFQTLVKD